MQVRIKECRFYTLLRLLVRCRMQDYSNYSSKYKKMQHGYPKMWVYCCDGHGCNTGAGIAIDNKHEANEFIKGKGWTLGEYDYCKRCTLKGNYIKKRNEQKKTT